jgi:uncharacterized protein (DUF4415 family)
MRTVAEPLLKVTLNLYAKDVAWFKDTFTHGYQEQIREALRAHIRYIEMMVDDDEYRK